MCPEAKTRVSVDLLRNYLTVFDLWRIVETFESSIGLSDVYLYLTLLHRTLPHLQVSADRYDPRYESIAEQQLVCLQMLTPEETNKLRKSCLVFPGSRHPDETISVILRPKSGCVSSVLCRSLLAYSLFMSRSLLWTRNLLSEYKTSHIPSSMSPLCCL